MLSAVTTGRVEPSIAVAAAKSSSTVEHELRCFGRSRRSPPLLCVSSRGTPSWKRMCQDALRDAGVPCTSAIRALLPFSFGHDPAHNFLLKRGCCRFAQAIGVTSDPRITFPYLLKIRASKLGLWAPAGSSTATASLDVPPSSSASSSQSNPRSARRTVGAPPLAISSIGAFRTPAVGACG
jgi:hypothetical protein